MKRVTGYFLAGLLLFFGGIKTAHAEPAACDDCDKVAAPFFFVKSQQADGVESLPLKATRVNVAVAGVIARVQLQQEYQNTGSTPIEAIYVFPGSTRASVHGMKMTIGERVRIARIKEKEQARQEYNEAKQQGKTASLLEQERPNVFKMNVANILPGDTILVDLEYSELLVPTDGEYMFMFPTVVGPRYAGSEDAAYPKEGWVENPYLYEGEQTNSEFTFSLALKAGMPIQHIASSSHAIDVMYKGKNEALIDLQQENQGADTKDIVIKYRLQGNDIETGMLLYESEEENFFVMMMEPPARHIPAQMPGREYIFTVDISGSMFGFPLEVSKHLMKELFTHLTPEDTFNLVLFEGGTSLFSETSVPATAENLERAFAFFYEKQGGGGTELLSALRRAYSIPRQEHMSRTVVVITDGYISAEAQVFDFIRTNLNRMNVFAFGIGSSVNRHLIEGIAHSGKGEPFVITDAYQVEQTARRFGEYISMPLLSSIEVAFQGFDVYDVEPQVLPDLMAARPLILTGKYRGTPGGTITVTGERGPELFERQIRPADHSHDPVNAALPFLWARERLVQVQDYFRLDRSEQRRQEITHLGLKYNVLTEFTSFIAVDEIVRSDGKQETVKQPLPLPEGVSNLAVGGASGSLVPGVPEPSLVILLLSALLSLAVWLKIAAPKRAGEKCER